MMLVLSLFFNNNTMSGATSRLGTDTHPEHTRKPSVFCGSCCSIFSFLHCVFWIIVCLLVLFPLAIVLSVLHRFTASDYPLVSWPLCCLSCDLRLLTTLWYLGHCIVCPVIYGFWLPFGILAIVLSVLWFTASDYPLVSSNFSSFKIKMVGNYDGLHA